MTKSGVVLLSGGMDSAVACAIAQRECSTVHCLTFDYGQRHKAEIAAARAIASRLRVDSHIVLSLPIGTFGGSAITDTSLGVPVADKSKPAEIPSTYVPCRNLVFLSVASSFAEARGCQRIYIGVNAVDYSGYPDCRPEFVEAFNEALRHGSKAGAEVENALEVVAPLVQMSKADIVLMAAELEVDLAKTVSCYAASGNGAACGKCDACALRRVGFLNAGLLDPTTYQ